MLAFESLVIYSLALVIPVLFLAYHLYPAQAHTSNSPEIFEKPLKSIMQAPRADLAPPKDDPFTTEELEQFNGSDSTKPIYVAIKGTVFDVSTKADVYGPGKSYSIFAGKDGSKGLGMSSLKPEHAVSDYSTLDEKDLKVLNDWHSFFSKRYNIVGRVVDNPSSNM